MVDLFRGNPELDSPAQQAQALPNATTTVLEHTSRAVYVGGTGSLIVVMRGGQEVTLADVPAGTLLPIRITELKSSSTATSVVAFW